MNYTPLVSVILPTYNYGHYICEAIESVLNSHFPQDEIEIIVVDDGSTDDTADKVRVYGNKLRYVSQKNSGKASATKVGVDLARGKYLFNLDADDLFLPNKISEVVKVFESESPCVHVAHPAICWVERYNIKTDEVIPQGCLGKRKSGKELLSCFYKRRVLYGGGSTFAARTEIVKRFLIPKQVDMFIDEYLLLLTLNQGDSFFIKQPLSLWRIHGKNFSASSSNGARINKTKVLRKLESVEAVLTYVLKSDFDEEIKSLYRLKAKVEELGSKEQLDDKSISDIIMLWSCLPDLFRVFGLGTLGIIRSYKVLNRTLPTSTLNLLKSWRRA